jgi:predicted transposase YbfD/YdcC
MWVSDVHMRHKESPMQYTPPAPPAPSPTLPAPAPPRPVAPATLLAAFAGVPDPRRRQGTRYALPAVLALAVLAILANHGSVQAVAEWGAAQGAELLRALGFRDGRAPHQSTLHRLFRRLDPAPLTAALTAHFAPGAAPDPAARGSQGVAIDGKAQRGRLPFATAPGCPVHALTAYCHEQGVVLAQEAITSDAEKAEAELTVAPALVARLDWHGRVLTGDALFCQRALCERVLAAGGDYLLAVKENQPTLHADLALLFDPPADDPGDPLLDRREASTTDHGHGRRDEVRHLVASTDLVGYCAWPGLAQVIRLERTWRENGVVKRALHYAVTSLPPAAADPARLLALKRGPWAIENGLHRTKDTALGEDASRVHLGAGPAVLALLRDTAVSLLHRADCRQIARQLRHFSRHPVAALPLLGLAVP